MLGTTETLRTGKQRTESVFTEIFQSVMVASFTTIVHFMVYFCPPVLLHAHNMYVCTTGEKPDKKLYKDYLDCQVQYFYLHKNNQAAKKCGPFQNGQCEKSCEIKGRGAKNGFVDIGWWQKFNNNYSGQFVLSHLSLTLRISTNSPELLLLKFLPS